MQLDGPTRRSFRALLRSPGQLSAVQIEPEGDIRTVHPIRLYLTINLLFFFLAPWVNSANISVWSVHPAGILQAQPSLAVPLNAAIEHSGAEDKQLFLALLEERLSAQQGAFVWLLVPAIGFASFAVARRRRRYLVEHFIFATNLVSFLLISLLAVGLACRAILSIVATDSKWLMMILLPIVGWMVWVLLVVFKSSKTFHAFSRYSTTAAFTLWIGAALYLGIWIYMRVLFLATLLGLRDLTFPS